jgi:hypothetical protein
MPPLPTGLYPGASSIGGVIGYPSEQLYGEVACIASKLHWSLEDIINLEHSDRRRWVLEAEKLNIGS